MVIFMTKLIICPNDVKRKILEENSKSNELVNIKFLTKKEFIDNYYFSYDDKTLYYLMDKYHYNSDTHLLYNPTQDKLELLYHTAFKMSIKICINLRSACIFLRTPTRIDRLFYMIFSNCQSNG